MPRVRLVCVVGVACVAAAPACGGANRGGGDPRSAIVGGPACGVDACGGDLVGAWRLTEMCIDGSVLMADLAGRLMGTCPAARVGSISYFPSGGMVFNADFTYSIDVQVSGSLAVNIPASCFPAGTTCLDFSAELQESLARNASVQSASCAGAGICACTIVETPSQASETGSYTLTGAALVTTAAGTGDVVTTDYCVSGATLTVFEPPGEALTAFVAQRQ
jgi:hypothetical protein